MKRTAFKFLVRVGEGGHNNIKINPVFRGMVFADRIKIKRKIKIKKRGRQLPGIS